MSAEVKESILHVNGEIKVCPFVGRTLTPGAIQGQLNLAEKPCGTWCPLFVLEKDGKNITINCGAIPIQIWCDDITLINPTKEPSKLKLI